ncbi:QcrA and Rieske domain-containing protein [Desulforhopalus singaporensis]|uniref:Cytochrome b6-f complex iron-sulfur subunit n=1 Tax=Desulforhopalus singaporensis TaxID=91360 RepID=A0A1H0V6P1_9BACT|nr:Rieske 2Fe-2S domain-containing protein [Desulforhopalus singaporensis]SDP74209.1 cytochrome b6-f complex iron-sulfur subunit [Desulforhopalus singaporensis]
MTKENKTEADVVRQDNEQVKPAFPRRSLIKKIWALIGLLAGIELAWIGTTILASRQKRGDKQTDAGYIDVAKVETFQPGTVTAVARGGFYVSRLEDGSFLALTSTCTHLGCALPWDNKERKFICPCHGSTFDCRGDVLSSPATSALSLHPLRLENGVVRVDISRRIRRSAYNESQAVRI